jgi:hypothetical protein
MRTGMRSSEGSDSHRKTGSALPDSAGKSNHDYVSPNYHAAPWSHVHAVRIAETKQDNTGRIFQMATGWIHLEGSLARIGYPAQLAGSPDAGNGRAGQVAGCALTDGQTRAGISQAVRRQLWRLRPMASWSC